jgi:hypothetical protein
MYRSFISIIKYIHMTIKTVLASAVVALGMAASVASAQVVGPITCSIEATNLGNGRTQLTWGSVNAMFASIDNNVGSVAADGQAVVATQPNAVYTLHVWNAQGTGSYCSTRATGTAPVLQTVTVTTTSVTHNGQVIALNNVPYTGAEDYISAAIFLALALSAGYAVKAVPGSLRSF